MRIYIRDVCLPGVRAVLLPLTALVIAVVPLPPTLVERAFSHGLYPRLQPWMTALSNQLPVAVLDGLVAVAAVLAAWHILRTWRRRAGLARWMGRIAWDAIRVAAVVYLAFLVVWGFNYRRASAVERFGVDDRRIVEARLRALAERAVHEANRLWPERGDETRLAGEALVADLAPPFEAAARATGTPWRVEPGRPKASLIAHAFPLAAVDGMVNPFGLEVILNPEVLPFERPFVLAHEWGHLAGYADESEASFAGFVTCLNGTPAAQYSGWVSLLLHALDGLPPADRRAVAERLGPGPRADIRAIVARARRAQPVVHAVSWRIYDRYLRANRVAEGVGSYDAVTRLVLGSALTASLGDPLPESTTPTSR